MIVTKQMYIAVYILLLVLLMEIMTFFSFVGRTRRLILKNDYTMICFSHNGRQK